MQPNPEPTAVFMQTPSLFVSTLKQVGEGNCCCTASVTAQLGEQVALDTLLIAHLAHAIISIGVGTVLVLCKALVVVVNKLLYHICDAQRA